MFLQILLLVFSLPTISGTQLYENPFQRFANNSSLIFDLVNDFGLFHDPLRSILNLHPAQFLCEKSKTLSANISENCLEGIQDFACALGNQLISDDPLWPFKVLDSFGKPPAGILQGDMAFWPGDYKQCKEINVVVINDKDILRSHSWQGAYCVAKLGMPNFLGDGPRCNSYENTTFLIVGTCVPDTCNSDDLNVVFHEVIPLFEYVTCHSIFVCEPEKQASKMTWVMLVVIIIVCFFLLVGTIFDICCYRSAVEKRLGWCCKFLMVFSLYANGRRLLSTAEGQLECLHGIRVLSMAWVILVHVYVFSLGYLNNIIIMAEYPRQYLFQILNNGSVSVDSFFFLSGFLVSYLFFKRIQSSQGAKQLKTITFWAMYYIHRYFRLTPVYGIVIALSVGLWDFLGSGPYWQNVDINTNLKNCPNNWWKNMLYINNFQNITEHCLGWVWYLANDMQFYVISPPILLLLYFLPNAGVAVTIGLVIASCTLRAYVIVANDLVPLAMGRMNGDWNTDNKFNNIIYQKPWMRVGPYFIGIIFGWLLIKTHGRFRIKKALVPFLWLFVFGLSFVVIFGPNQYVLSYGMDDLCKGLFGGFGRVGWGLVVGCTVYLCLQGYGGFLNTIFSCSIFTPLSRLTYCAYLVHELVISYYFSILNTQIYSTHYTMFNLFLSNLFLSYAVALVLNLAIEAPFMQIEKFLFEPRKKEKILENRQYLVKDGAVHKID